MPSSGTSADRHFALTWFDAPTLKAGRREDGSIRDGSDATGVIWPKKGRALDLDLPGLADLFTTAIEAPTKLLVPLVAAGRLRGGVRQNAAVEAISTVIIDVDDGLTIEEGEEAVAGSCHILYTTASHTPEHHRYRVVVPLARDVTPKEFPLVRQHVVGLLGGHADENARDLARLAAVEAGEVTRVVVRHLDRLGRGVVLEQVVATLKQHGVELWSFDGQQDIYSAAGRLGVRAQAMVGAFEVERTGERVREMKRQKAKQGFYMGPTPFGFTSQARIRRELEARYGDAERAKTEAQQAIPVSGRLHIDEAEAQVVREVFRLYVEEGFGAGRIARRLNGRGHRTRQGCRWHSQQVQGIIHDPKVAGYVSFDEDAYERRLPSAKPVHEQALFPGQHDAIIPMDLWHEAQEVRKQNGASLRDRDFTPRTYALTGVLVCRDGHTAKAKSCGMVSGHLYYGCRRRFIDGADPALGGCDAPIIRVEAADAAVRRVLADLLSHPEQVHAYLDAASRQTRRDRVPQADRSHDLDEQIQKMEQAVERYFKLLEGTEPGSDEERVLLDRVVELRRRLAEAKAERENLRCEVIPLPPTVTREQVEAWCQDLTRHLESDARGFRRLVETLHDRHDLRVQILDADRVRVSLAIDPADLAGGRRLVAVARVELEGSEEAALSNDEWVQREQAKDPRCACGCGGAITVKPQHRAASRGIPRFLPGHAPSGMEKVIDEIRAAGFLTSQDMMAVLGCSSSQLSRLVKAGRLVPAGEWTVGGRRVRYFEMVAG